MRRPGRGGPDPPCHPSDAPGCPCALPGHTQTRAERPRRAAPHLRPVADDPTRSPNGCTPGVRREPTSRWHASAGPARPGPAERPPGARRTPGACRAFGGRRAAGGGRRNGALCTPGGGYAPRAPVALMHPGCGGLLPTPCTRCSYAPAVALMHPGAGAVGPYAPRRAARGSDALRCPGRWCSKQFCAEGARRLPSSPTRLSWPPRTAGRRPPPCSRSPRSTSSVSGPLRSEP